MDQKKIEEEILAAKERLSRKMRQLEKYETAKRKKKTIQEKCKKLNESDIYDGSIINENSKIKPKSNKNVSFLDQTIESESSLEQKQHFVYIENDDKNLSTNSNLGKSLKHNKEVNFKYHGHIKKRRQKFSPEERSQKIAINSKKELKCKYDLENSINENNPNCERENITENYKRIKIDIEQITDNSNYVIPHDIDESLEKTQFVPIENEEYNEESSNLNWKPTNSITNQDRVYFKNAEIVPMSHFNFNITEKIIDCSSTLIKNNNTKIYIALLHSDSISIWCEENTCNDCSKWYCLNKHSLDKTLSRNAIITDVSLDSTLRYLLCDRESDNSNLYTSIINLDTDNCDKKYMTNPHLLNIKIDVVNCLSLKQWCFILYGVCNGVPQLHLCDYDIIFSTKLNCWKMDISTTTRTISKIPPILQINVPSFQGEICLDLILIQDNSYNIHLYDLKYSNVLKTITYGYDTLNLKIKLLFSAVIKSFIFTVTQISDRIIVEAIDLITLSKTALAFTHLPSSQFASNTSDCSIAKNNIYITSLCGQIAMIKLPD